MSTSSALLCPRCGNDFDIHPSKTQIWFRDALMALIGKRPFRCYACSARFYARTP